jgi:hypothetical protein
MPLRPLTRAQADELEVEAERVLRMAAPDATRRELRLH